MSIPPVLDLAAVADLLGLERKTFQSRRGRLQRDYGFPRALPGLGPRWSLAAVLAWVDQQVPAASPDNVIDLRARLMQKYRGAA